MGGDEIRQQKAAERVAAGKDGEGQFPHGPEDDESVEILRLDHPDAEVHLVERRDEDQDDRKQEERDGELERNKEVAHLAQERGKFYHGAERDWRKARKAGFSAET